MHPAVGGQHQVTAARGAGDSGHGLPGRDLSAQRPGPRRVERIDPAVGLQDPVPASHPIGGQRDRCHPGGQLACIGPVPGGAEVVHPAIRAQDVVAETPQGIEGDEGVPAPLQFLDGTVGRAFASSVEWSSGFEPQCMSRISPGCRLPSTRLTTVPALIPPRVLFRIRGCQPSIRPGRTRRRSPPRSCAGCNRRRGSGTTATGSAPVTEVIWLCALSTW